MIKDVCLGVEAPAETVAEKLDRFKQIKEALNRHKRGLPPDDIKLEDIPF
jgi:hypothetical protein